MQGEWESLHSITFKQRKCDLVINLFFTATDLKYVHDSAIGRPHKDRPVIIDIYDGDLKNSGSPERRSAMIGRHYSQIKPLKTLQ